MNSQPLVSVIALNYNQGKFLEETLESVRNQTYKNIELIICDDFSTDDSRIKIANWIERNNYKVKLIFNEENLGYLKSSNLAVKATTGYYVCFIACDDIMLPDKLTKLVHEFSFLDSSYMAIYTDAQLINDESNIFGEISFIQLHRTFLTPPSGFIFDDLKKGNFIPWPALLIKNEAYKKVGYFDEKLFYIEDWDLLLRISKHYKIHYSTEPLVKYRLHSQNIHKSEIYLFNARYEEYRIIMKHLDNPYFGHRSKSLLVKSYLRGYGRFDEMLSLYKTSVGNDFLSKILSLKMPFIFFKAINSLLPASLFLL